MIPSVAGNLNSFAIIVGKCVWVPPSAKAAFLFVAYFFGVVPDLAPEVYEHDLTREFVVAGMTAKAARRELHWLNDCTATYVVPPQNMSGRSVVGRN
jgi:hypothetical protein